MERNVNERGQLCHGSIEISEGHCQNYRIDRLSLPNFGDRVLDCGRDDARAAAAFIAHVLGAFQVGHISDEGVESCRLGQLPSSFKYKSNSHGH